MVTTHHFAQRELAALSDDLAIDGDHRTAVVVDAVAVTALLVGQQVDTPTLNRNKHQPSAVVTALLVGQQVDTPTLNRNKHQPSAAVLVVCSR